MKLKKETERPTKEKEMNASKTRHQKLDKFEKKKYVENEGIEAM